MMRAVAALAIGLALLGTAARAQDLAPILVKPQQENANLVANTQKDIDQLKGVMDKIKDATGGKIDTNTINIGALKNYGLKAPGVTDALQAALNLMQEYGIIDPSENAMQPDFNPPGQPQLASRGAKDPNLSAEEYGNFRKLQQMMDNARSFLEKNYLVLRQTETKTGRLMQLANSAANMNGIAGLYWTKAQIDPNDPMNKSKALFYANYDKGQASGLAYLQTALKQMAEFEKRNYGDQNWYGSYGLPYYNFMVARYTRPGGAGSPP